MTEDQAKIMQAVRTVITTAVRKEPRLTLPRLRILLHLARPAGSLEELHERVKIPRPNLIAQVHYLRSWGYLTTTTVPGGSRQWIDVRLTPDAEELFAPPAQPAKA